MVDRHSSSSSYECDRVCRCEAAGLRLEDRAEAAMEQETVVTVEIEQPFISDQRQASWWSNILFLWTLPLLLAGYRSPLQEAWLSPVAAQDQPASLRRGLAAAMPETRARAGRAARWVWLVVLRQHAQAMLVPGLCKAVGDLLGFATLLLLRRFLSAFGEPGFGDWAALGRPGQWASSGYALGLGMCASAWLQSLCLHQHHFRVIRAGMNARTALVALAYVRLVRVAHAPAQPGHIVNVITNDADVMEKAFWNGHYTWAAPLQIVLTLALLVREMGVLPSLSGAVVIVVLMIAQTRLSVVQSAIKKSMLQHTDRRLSIIHDLIIAIRCRILSLCPEADFCRLLKQYAWEMVYAEVVHDERDLELGQLLRMVLVRVANGTLLACGPIVVTAVAFAVYAVTSSTPLTPTVVRLPLLYLGLILFVTCVLPLLCVAL